MHSTENNADDGRVMNVLQVVALSVVTTTGAVVAYSAAGAPFGASLMAGFATGPFLTMAIALSLAWVKDKGTRSRKATATVSTNGTVGSGPPVVHGPISTIEELWNSDQMLEMEFAREQNSQNRLVRSRRATTTDHIAMWELDAARDAERAKMPPQKPTGTIDDVHRGKGGRSAQR